MPGGGVDRGLDAGRDREPHLVPGSGVDYWPAVSGRFGSGQDLTGYTRLAGGRGASAVLSSVTDSVRAHQSIPMPRLGVRGSLEQTGLQASRAPAARVSRGRRGLSRRTLPPRQAGCRWQARSRAPPSLPICVAMGEPRLRAEMRTARRCWPASRAVRPRQPNPGVLDGVEGREVGLLAAQVDIQALLDLRLPVAVPPRRHHPSAHDQFVDALQRLGHPGTCVELPTAAERTAWSAAGRAVSWTPAPPGAGPSSTDIPPLRFRVVLPAQSLRRADVDYDGIAATLLGALAGTPA